MLTQKKNLQLIQLLRGIACILVVLRHITVTFFQTFHADFLSGIFNSGGSGVDIFFVLSGFIITYSNRQSVTKPGTTGKFLKKRLIRIFPIYWIITSFFLVLQVLLPSFYRTAFQFTVANVLSTYLLLPNHAMVNGVSWSLTNELAFYILFTIALLVPQKKIILWLLFIYAVILLLAAIPFTVSESNDRGFLGLLLLPMNIEFLLGILVVLMVERLPASWGNGILSTGIGLFIAATIFSWYGLSVFHNTWNRVLLFGFPAFLIILSLVKFELGNTIRVNKLILATGDASYSIYLFHLPVVAAFFKLIVKLPTINHACLVLLSIGLLFVICFMGILIFKKIENPVLRWLNKNI